MVTHDYIDGNGTIEQSAGYGETSPQYLFDNLVKQYANIRFVFSGHTGIAGNRVDTGVNGNKIYSFLQTFHSNSTNPVRLVEVDTAANSLRTWIYARTTTGRSPSTTGRSRASVWSAEAYRPGSDTRRDDRRAGPSGRPSCASRPRAHRPRRPPFSA
ncbi:hypothetical protein NKG94_05050 [Micromonospora sp. M12]